MPQAVAEAEVGGGKLEDRVRLDDLAAAGWTISPWVRSGSGTAQIELSKPFSSPDQVAGIIAEVSGPNGPVKDVAATRDRGAASTSYSVTGAIDLAAIGTGVTADQDLVNALTNQQVDVNAIDQSLLAELRSAVSVSVVVNFPDGSSTTVNGVAGQRVPIDVSTSIVNTRRLASARARGGARGARDRRAAHRPSPPPGARTGAPLRGPRRVTARPCDSCGTMSG